MDGKLLGYIVGAKTHPLNDVHPDHHKALVELSIAGLVDCRDGQVFATDDGVLVSRQLRAMNLEPRESGE